MSISQYSHDSSHWKFQLFKLLIFTSLGESVRYLFHNRLCLNLPSSFIWGWKVER